MGSKKNNTKASNKKRGARSNKKGKSFENKVAKELSKWYSRLEPKQKFHRIPMSGALRWNNSVVFTYGDVLPPPECRTIIECKHHRTVSVYDIFNDKKPSKNTVSIPSWWFCQLEVDIRRCYEEVGLEMVPLLIFKKDRAPELVGMSRDMFDILVEHPLNKNLVNSSHMIVSSKAIKYDLVLVKLSDFISCVDPSAFNECCIKELKYSGAKYGIKKSQGGKKSSYKNKANAKNAKVHRRSDRLDTST